MHISRNKAKGKTRRSLSENPVQVEVTGKLFHVSSFLKQLITEKARQLPLIHSVHVVITSHKDKEGAEIHVVASSGRETIQTKVFHKNPYTGIITAFKKLRTAASKHQQILQERRRDVPELLDSFDNE